MSAIMDTDLAYITMLAITFLREDCSDYTDKVLGDIVHKYKLLEYVESVEEKSEEELADALEEAITSLQEKVESFDDLEY